MQIQIQGKHEQEQETSIEMWLKAAPIEWVLNE